jgi:hypothetical protein
MADLLIADVLGYFDAASGNLVALQTANPAAPKMGVITEAVAAKVTALAAGPSFVPTGALDPAQWTYVGANNGTLTATTDPVLGAVLNINVTNPGTRHYATRDLDFAAQPHAGVSFWIKRDANATVFDAELHVADHAGSKKFSLNKSLAMVEAGVWARIVVPCGEIESMNAGITAYDSTGLTKLRIGITATGGLTTTLQVAGLTAHRVPEGSVTLLFDDARTDTYTTAYPIMSALGMVGSVAAEYNRLGTVPSYSLMTLAQLTELYAAGWDVLGHHSVGMAGQSESFQTGIYQAQKDWARANGFVRGAHIWCWPGGLRDAAAETYAQRYYQVCRRTGTMAQHGIPGVFDPIRPQMVYINNSTTVPQITTRVDRVKLYGGNVVFVLHSLVTNKVAAEDFLISDFQAVCWYIAAAAVPVIPASAVWWQS